VKAYSGSHPYDEVADDECDHLHYVNGVDAKPENSGHGTYEGKADQERVVDSLLERSTTGKNAARLTYTGRLAGTGDRH
jgi:hypothetical protein